MAPRDVATGVVFLSQTALGLLGNSACLLYFWLTDSAGSRVRPTDLILRNLTWANLMVLLFKGVPQTMAAFGLARFLDAAACKLLFYLHRVARGVSLGSMCLLSIFQAITIHSRISRWAQLKLRATRFVGPSLLLCWALHLLVNVLIPISVTDIAGRRNHSGLRDFGYCAVVSPRRKGATLYSAVLASTDVLCLGLMMWASGSMVLVLCRHKKRVEHIHRSLSSRSSPESRATRSTLALVSSFVLSYTTSTILTTYLSLLDGATSWLVNANVAMAACFPAFFPFLLLSQYTMVSRPCSACWRQMTAVLP